MIPHRCKSKEEMELYLFKELDIDVEKLSFTNSKMMDEYSDFLCEKVKGNHDIYEVIGVTDDYVIAYGGDADFLVFTENDLNLKVADLIDCWADAYYHRYLADASIICKIVNRLNSFILKSINSCNFDSLDIKNIITDGVIDVIKIQSEIERLIHVKNAENEKAIKLQREKDEKAKTEKENYLKTGEYHNFICTTTLNSISYPLGEKIVLLKRTVPSLISLDILKQNAREYLGKDRIKHMLIFNRIDFEYARADGVICKVVFKDENKIYVNDIEIKHGKLDILLEKVSKDVNEDELKLLSSMNGIKFRALEISKVRYISGDKEIPLTINFIPVNTHNFKINFLGGEVVLFWQDIRKLFFEENSISEFKKRLTSDDLMKIAEVFKLSKQQVFDYLKKITMLETLKNEST